MSGLPTSPGRLVAHAAGVLAVAAATVLPAGCGDAGDASPATAAPVTDVVERGPVRLEVSVPRGEVRVGDAVALAIDVVAEPGVEVEIPPLGETVGPFAVRAARTPPDVPDPDGRRRWSHAYRLVTFEADDLEIPAVTIRFADRRGETPVEGELTAGPLVVTVVSAVADAFDPATPSEIRGAVDLPFGAASWWRVAAAAMVAAALGAGVVMAAWWWTWRRRHPAPRPVPVIPAHVWALERLAALEASPLLERHRVHEFYVRLSDIARGYIERRFDLRAPERTTDEFLREARLHPALGEDHRDLLARFLRAADMVKFARHEPARPECEAALAAARSFVERTAPRHGADTVAPGAAA
ncbi:MAG: hypothetical protein ACYTG1_13610 [Planctomycetota bacterium]|jgi:hypothetical protein